MNREKKNWYIAGVAAAVILIAPLVTNRESIDLEDARRNISANYVGRDGWKTQYQREMTEGATEQVILVHGSSGPMTTWDKTFEFLTKNGFDVVRYNFYGRGLSDRPDYTYTLESYAEQLATVLSELKITKPMHLVGHSFGSVVVAEFAQMNPDLVKSVTLISPAGFKLESNPASSLLRLPILGDYVMRLIGDGMLLSHNKKYFYDPKKHKKLIKAYIAQSKIKGFKRVQKSTFLNAPLQAYEQGFAGLGKSGLPVKLIWAKDDLTFPFVHSQKALELIPQASLEPISEARHVPQYEQSDVVNPILLQWLTSQNDPARP